MSLREDQYGATLHSSKDTGAVTGCLFGNLALELSSKDETIRERLQEIFDAQIDMVAVFVELAKGDDVVQVTDTREAARALVAQLEGMVLFAKLLDDPAQLDQLWSHSLALLGATRANVQPGREVSRARVRRGWIQGPGRG
ncbi:MAG TPA: TetR family transcriptional regulator C-terminal domain-containing protein [Kribbella sp.]|nr:TetR family transcriptional regulator C-terminal domain-containing protein [Kribbella sp.]